MPLAVWPAAFLHVMEVNAMPKKTEPKDTQSMPVFDPDADITGLTLTIPSWTGSIHRIQTKTDLSIISSAARSALIRELHVLVDKACEMLQILEEE